MKLDELFLSLRIIEEELSTSTSNYYRSLRLQFSRTGMIRQVGDYKMDAVQMALFMLNLFSFDIIFFLWVYPFKVTVRS